MVVAFTYSLLEGLRRKVNICRGLAVKRGHFISVFILGAFWLEGVVPLTAYVFGFHRVNGPEVRLAEVSIISADISFCLLMDLQMALNS